MKLFVFRLLFLLLIAGAGSLVHADSGGARVVKYSDSDIIPIRAKVRFSTLIVLPAEEEILDFTTGDKDFWIINGVHNLCYLHPAQPGIRSNLNLVTASGHVYSFLLTEISKEADSDPDLKVFVAPNEEQATAGHPTTARFARASEVEAYQGQIAELRTELAGQIQQAQEHAVPFVRLQGEDPMDRRLGQDALGQDVLERRQPDGAAHVEGQIPEPVAER